MNHRFSLLLVASCALLVAVVLLLRNTTKEQPGNKAKSPSTVAATKEPVPKSSTIQAGRPDPEKHGDIEVQPAGRALTQKAILDQIEEASVTYDAKALPLIQPYLLHPDSVVREAAKNGMINLGDASAGPLLREASRHATTPQEAVALSEAADYVELPPATVTRKKASAPASARTETSSLKTHAAERHSRKKQDEPTPTE